MQVMPTMHTESPRGTADEGDFSRTHPASLTTLQQPLARVSVRTRDVTTLFADIDATPSRFTRHEPTNEIVVRALSRKIADRA